jgi:hypothetical protein
VRKELAAGKGAILRPCAAWNEPLLSAQLIETLPYFGSPWPIYENPFQQDKAHKRYPCVSSHVLPATFMLGPSPSDPSTSKQVGVPSLPIRWAGGVVIAQGPLFFSLVCGLPETCEHEANKSLEQPLFLSTTHLHSIRCLAFEALPRPAPSCVGASKNVEPPVQ